MQREQQKRLVIQFDEEENKKLNNNIAKIVLDITNNIQLYEKNLKQFVKENINNNTDNII